MEALKNKRILIVDDIDADRMLLSAYLEKLGCHLFYACDGLEAIEQARTRKPDIILMDSDMPLCNGRDACKVITQDPRTQGIPIIFISGMTSADHRIRGLLAGAVDYINKPFDFNEVKLRIVIHLKKQQSITTQENKEQPTKTQSASNLHTILFHSARTHLLKSLSTTPLMKDLEKLTGTNSKQLNAAFKACAGVTVYDYLREERMKEAKILLQKTQLSVQDISFQVGFINSTNFATAFKKRFGFTPREFRQQYN